MEVLNAVFNALSTIVTGIVSVITNAFTGVTGLWYTPASGDTPGQLTMLGVFSLIAFVVGVVWLAIRFIGSMIALKSAR